MASKIVPLIPPHTVYVEPFAGGAAVFYAKPKPKITNHDHYREVLNDISGDLVHMYQFAKSCPKTFSKLLAATPFSAEVYRNACIKQQTTCKVAQAKYIRHNMSFSKKDRGGFCRGTVSENSAASWVKYTESSRVAAERLSGVYLDHLDALKCISVWDSPNTFFYVDPPYLGTCVDGMGEWTLKNLIDLCCQMNKCRGSWIVSGYNEARGLLHFDQRMAFSASCSASGSVKANSNRNHGEPIKRLSAKRIEQLYMRGPTALVRSSLIPVLEKQTCFTGPLLGPCPLPLKTHPSARKAAPLSK